MAALWFLLSAAALGCAAQGARAMLAERRLEARLGLAQASAPLRQRPGLFSASGRDRSEIAGKLRLAGFQDARAPDWFVWARLGATLGVALLVMLASHLASGSVFAQPLLIVIACGLTYVGAKQAIHLLAARRARAIMAEFPFLLDLMLMMLESGISLDQCFRSIARDEGIAVPQHARLIALLVADLDRGMRYDLALDRWAARVAVSGAKELASLFRQALFQGVELAPALREFVREFTQRRVMRAREAMGGITVRMVVLMILFFMPALFVVLGGPPVVAIFDTLKGVSR
jgi:tight adherence protein C